MKVDLIYLCIFGNKYGTGHLVRAINYIKNTKYKKYKLLIILEEKDDVKYLSKYIKKYEIYSSENKYESISYINDTLGLFYVGNIQSEKYISIDSLHNAAPLNYEKWYILYDQPGAYKVEHELFIDRSKVILILQGGGDDYGQIIPIIRNIPKKYKIIVGVGSGCRHIDDIYKEFNNRFGGVLKDITPKKLSEIADLIITSGGNILREILSESGKIIIYTKEEKEYLTIKKLSNLNFKKIFKINEPFKWNSEWLK